MGAAHTPRSIHQSPPSGANQFTVRWTRPSGVPTERDKILAGAQHGMFYGITGDGWRGFASFVVLDFRGRLDAVQRLFNGRRDMRGNTDGSSQLAAFRVKDAWKLGLLRNWYRAGGAGGQ